ncbi:MAG: fused MFS/spermidine synthase [Steroidobacteraceae bacterium]
MNKLSKPIFLILAALLATSSSAMATVLHTEKSLYRNIVVYTEDDLRCMRFGRYDGNRQSCVSITEPNRLVFNYTRMMMGALYLNPTPQRVLIIGLGGGTLPSTLQKLFPTVQIDVAEIDPAVTKVARKYFGFDAGNKIRVAEEDGRVFVKRALKQTTRYDLIMLDAFDHEYIPEHMLTREFLQEVRGLLTPNGVLAANTFSSSRLYDYESITYQTVFGDFFNLKDANRVILTRMNGLPNQEELRRNAQALESKLKPLGVGSDFLLPKLTATKDWPANTRVLTDQYSPANLLNSK